MASSGHARIAELWIYPVKSCQGVRVKSRLLTPSGFDFDRAWCVVDLDGTVVSKHEAISQRKVPILATVQVAEDAAHFLLAAPGMQQLALPLAMAEYDSCEELRVECSGKSTTTGGGWSLGFELGKVWKPGSDWFTEYLNRPGKDGNRLHGKSEAARFALVRSVECLKMSDYPPIFPVLEKAKEDPEYRARFEGSQKRFADFAPLLLVSKASAEAVGTHCPEKEVQSYPLQPMRANVIVEGATAWNEETWQRVVVRRAASGEVLTTLLKIKECPRCTIPCRDQLTGGWVFPGESLRLWRILGKLFPRKAKDPEWGTWAGPFFGVYFGHGGETGAEIREGDTLEVVQSCAWDAHLTARAVSLPCVVGSLVSAALLALTAALLVQRKR